MKRILILALAWMLALSSTAFAFNPDRFEGAENVTVEYDAANPSDYKVKGGFVTDEAWSQFGGHLVARYSNAGKSSEIPMILVGFTSSKEKVSHMAVRTDARRYSVTCTDLTGVGLSAIDAEGTVMVTNASIDMLRDIADSSYTKITLWDDDPGDAFSFLLADSARPMLRLFLSEYDEEIAGGVAEDETLLAVYERLSPIIAAEDAAAIGDEAKVIATAQYETLRNGSQGDAVVRLQQALIAARCLNGRADGIYGNQTRAAVSRFQKSVGLAENGIADAATQIALFMSALDFAD